MGRLRIAVVQMESKLGREPANLRRAERYVRQAAGDGADLVCLPEAFLTSGNILEVADVAVPIPGDATDQLCRVAAELGVHIVAGLLERGEDASYYSTSVLIDRTGELRGTYRRVHRHELESRYLAGGTEYPTFDLDIGRVGLMQGYDVNFPEVSREYLRRGWTSSCAPRWCRTCSRTWSTCVCRCGRSTASVFSPSPPASATTSTPASATWGAARSWPTPLPRVGALRLRGRGRTHGAARRG